MQVMIIILKNETLLKDISQALVECGIFETSILDGEGIESSVYQGNPVFSQLQGLFGRELPYNRTIISFIPEPEMLTDFMTICRDSKIDFSQPDTGVVMSFPCSFYLGPDDSL